MNQELKSFADLHLCATVLAIIIRLIKSSRNQIHNFSRERVIVGWQKGSISFVAQTVDLKQ